MSHAEASRRWSKNNKPKRRVIQWRYRGISCSWTQYESLLHRQGNKCAICQRHESEFKQGLALDHNHYTGKIRGLLCFTCNKSLVSLVEDHADLLAATKDYLEKNDA